MGVIVGVKSNHRTVKDNLLKAVRLLDVYGSVSGDKYDPQVKMVVYTCRIKRKYCYIGVAYNFNNTITLSYAIGKYAELEKKICDKFQSIKHLDKEDNVKLKDRIGLIEMFAHELSMNKIQDVIVQIDESLSGNITMFKTRVERFLKEVKSNDYYNIETSIFYCSQLIELTELYLKVYLERCDVLYKSKEIDIESFDKLIDSFFAPRKSADLLKNLYRTLTAFNVLSHGQKYLNSSKLEKYQSFRNKYVYRTCEIISMLSNEE